MDGACSSQKEQQNDEKHPHPAQRSVQGQSRRGGYPRAGDDPRFLARRHGIHADQIDRCKKEFMDRAASVFEQPGEPASGSEREKELLEKIGELTVERDFSARGLARPR